MKIKVSNVNTPNWKEVTVKSRIPVELERLSEIARNIWWAGNFEAVSYTHLPLRVEGEA